MGFQSPSFSVTNLSIKELGLEVGDNNITVNTGIRSKFEPRSPASARQLLFLPHHLKIEVYSLESRGSLDWGTLHTVDSVILY